MAASRDQPHCCLVTQIFTIGVWRQSSSTLKSMRWNFLVALCYGMRTIKIICVWIDEDKVHIAYSLSCHGLGIPKHTGKAVTLVEIRKPKYYILNQYFGMSRPHSSYYRIFVNSHLRSLRCHTSAEITDVLETHCSRSRTVSVTLKRCALTLSC